MPWVAVLLLAAVAVAPPAAAEEGLATAGTSRYVLDARRTTLEASITVELRNVTPDRGDVYYYFDTFAVPVPAGAQDVRATSGGSPLEVSLRRTEDPSTRLARISFPDLRFGRSRTLELTFDVPGEAPRSEDGTRVGPGYATFAVYGLGDAGRNTVEVVAPAEMTFDATSDDFSPTPEGATTTHTATTTDPGGGSWAVVSLRDPDEVEERPVDVAGTSLLLSGFPDDPRWADFVAGEVVKGIPALERLVGTPWPGGLERIREDASPSLRGYDGWFDPGDDEIVIGEALDADLLFHELAHAWVSAERFDERWVSEGLAQLLAERTVEAIGGTPDDQPTVSRGASGAVALNAWGGSAGSRSVDVDAYAYPAAYSTTRALLGDLDDTVLAEVVGAGIRGERAYDPAGTRDPAGARTSWQRWLDLLQTRGGVEDAPEIFERWALTEDERAQIRERADARSAYAALDEADGAWLPPEGLRDAMTAWDFDRAAAVREDVGGLGGSATRVQQAARRAGTVVPAAVRTAYEQAEQEEEYARLATTLPRAASTITAVGRAVAAAERDRDPVSRLGVELLAVEDLAADAADLLEQGRLDAAGSAAAQATGRAGRALLVGLAAPVLLTLLLGGLVLAARATVARRARRRASRAEAHAAVLATLGRGSSPEDPVSFAARSEQAPGADRTPGRPEP